MERTVGTTAATMPTSAAAGEAVVTLFASDDRTTWSASAVLTSSTPYGRYVRVQYEVTGNDPLINATGAVNTFQSS